MTAGLQIIGLRVAQAGREVLRGIDLALEPGEVHAVMGPNGSGKSTLAHAVMGKPGPVVIGGGATLDGHDLLSLPTWERARLGLFVAPQYPTEIPGVTLTDALEAARPQSAPASVSEQAAQEASRVGFGVALLERSLNVDLSGGERKRSETVQLGVLRPRVAVLDELDSGLDVDGLRAVARRIRAAVDEWGLGVLAITHYRRLLAELRPDVVHVLVHGRVVASGGPELADELEKSGYAPYGVPDEPAPPEAPEP